MRTESTTVRPFYGLPHEVEEAFQLVALRFSEDEEFQSERSLKVGLEPHESQLAVLFDETAVAKLKEWHDLPNWDVVVCLADESRRLSNLLCTVAATTVTNTPILSVPTRNLNVSWSGRKGGTLSLYMTLQRDRSSSPGLPRSHGHIAAMKHFSINRTGPGSEFPVDFWSAEQITEAGFPAESTVLVVGDADGLSESEPEEMQLRIVINDRLRAAFAHDRRSKRANVLQDTVRTQAVTQLLLLAKEFDEFEDDSVGAQLVKRVTGAAGRELSSLSGIGDVHIAVLAQVFCKLTESSAKVF
jgi:hypothetical protein